MTRLTRLQRRRAKPTGWIYADGGRAASGRRGYAGDCAVRALAIVMQRDYDDIYHELASLNQATGRPRSARDGTPIAVLRAYLDAVGWQWTPTMSIGSGTRVHLCADELPSGRIIARVTRHVCAVIDGVVHDIADPSRGGTRCVYGYWSPGG